MSYDSTITFTLDTVCPWTYLGFLQLRKALDSYRSANPSSPVTFKLQIAPYQLYPDFSRDGVDRHAWYPDPSQANTFHAHRILQYIQKHHGPEAAIKALESLYEQYFTQKAHPSSPETLLKACQAAGEEAMETRMAVREQTGNGVDSVPHIVFEGRKRDFTLIGTKEVGEYVKTLKQVVKEAS
ncbi:thioredoxin-like protein [Macroventuria anomochaeta]|uniref:Thioredoxin-like protein n=1 Tax=Macroventuria anomochaeta TaxID=301207 RepID=A0ACB6RGR8_9PLEO|nr:thioredoxin-like protein [Macroventuria anomochaeta]KAF2621141.1 thioredoxin-like protein [Macroventuria anomochaeta]